MAANPSGQGFQNKNRVAILAELDKEKRKLLMQNQSSASHPGASISLSRPSLNKDFRDHAEQQHIAAQQKAALQSSVVSVRHPFRCCPPRLWARDLCCCFFSFQEQSSRVC
ncbi:SOSS complex subunit C isoform X2 [Peromyscus eremicus]|uniref:SOSS complex subunit C isoform X2 n=1 Tax=Peromyscus eremicus TaxID=42410 RepID=UPI0027DB360C|nr:SOSS complex subunit C isoform X2 [Peromyscus eremicus]XP_059110398.1 SOSS complex subunit C isoform X2 [Peromyscus eremicus]XP_059110399.1 SOSS complex subunit C isoform X2 [Peromyscus eremicus]